MFPDRLVVRGPANLWLRCSFFSFIFFSVCVWGERGGLSPCVPEWQLGFPTLPRPFLALASRFRFSETRFLSSCFFSYVLTQSWPGEWMRVRQLHNTFSLEQGSGQNQSLGSQKDRLKEGKEEQHLLPLQPLPRN